MNKKGFSLVELLTVIALIGIVLGISRLSFNDWQKKYAIEALTKEMLTDLTNVRLMAIQSKKNHRVILNPRSYTFRRYSTEFDVAGTEVLSKPLKYEISQFSSGTVTAFSNTAISIDNRGYLTSLPMTIAVASGVGNPALNCLGVHSARVNMGRINGNNCDYQ